ncbi:hypothetical protein M569_09602 [Genlisea aurea]|uniref:Uncharacterized protein n=1 Tax=Genlisea aurea TaxID=192259 RepID=S8DYR0_9LAMI|nr:hypothetical protein M569_09602 [Genlisea aurea]
MVTWLGLRPDDTNGAGLIYVVFGASGGSHGALPNWKGGPSRAGRGPGWPGLSSAPGGSRSLSSQ